MFGPEYFQQLAHAHLTIYTVGGDAFAGIVSMIPTRPDLVTITPTDDPDGNTTWTDIALNQIVAVTWRDR